MEKIPAGLGVFRVTVDGEEVYKVTRLLYPRPKSVLAAVRDHLSGLAPA